MKIKKRYRLPGIVFLAVSVLVGFEIFIFSSNDHRNEDQTFQDKFNEDYRVYSIVMPEKLDFCGEKVPLVNEDVY